MNATLKSTLMALATASLALAGASACSDKSSEVPEATESSTGGEATPPDAAGGEGSCSGEGHCSGEHHGGEPPPEGDAPPVAGDAVPSP